jgi:hypothetical protein
MNKITLILLLIIPFVGFGQCIEGDCENGFGTYLLEKTYYDENDKPIVYKFKYIGEWKNGKKEGMGMLINLNLPKDRYYGEWKNNKRNGFGTETWVDVETGQIGGEYIGEFKDDDMNGEGTWIFIEIPENKKSLPTDIKKGIWNGMKLIEEK